MYKFEISSFNYLVQTKRKWDAISEHEWIQAYWDDFQSYRNRRTQKIFFEGFGLEGEFLFSLRYGSAARGTDQIIADKYGHFYDWVWEVEDSLFVKMTISPINAVVFYEGALNLFYIQEQLAPSLYGDETAIKEILDRYSQY